MEKAALDILTQLLEGQKVTNERLYKIENKLEKIEDKVDVTYDEVARTREDVTNIKSSVETLEQNVDFVESATIKNLNDIQKLKKIK